VLTFFILFEAPRMIRACSTGCGPSAQFACAGSWATWDKRAGYMLGNLATSMIADRDLRDAATTGVPYAGVLAIW